MKKHLLEFRIIDEEFHPKKAKSSNALLNKKNEKYLVRI